MSVNRSILGIGGIAAIVGLLAITMIALAIGGGEDTEAAAPGAETAAAAKARAEWTRAEWRRVERRRAEQTARPASEAEPPAAAALPAPSDENALPEEVADDTDQPVQAARPDPRTASRILARAGADVSPELTCRHRPETCRELGLELERAGHRGQAMKFYQHACRAGDQTSCDARTELQARQRLSAPQ